MRDPALHERPAPVVVLQPPVVCPAGLLAEVLPELPASLVAGEALGLGDALVESHLRATSREHGGA